MSEFSPIASKLTDRQIPSARRLMAFATAVGPANTARYAASTLSGSHRAKRFELGGEGKLRHPIGLTTLPSDGSNYNEVILREVYKLPEAWRSRLNGKPIVDIGAYIGMSAAYFASQYPDSKVTAVEPHPRNFDLLRINAGRYAGQIDPLNAAFALADRPVGFQKMGSLANGHMGYRFSAVQPAGEHGFSVPAITPQSLAASFAGPDGIGILKVDIEGAEREIFQSPLIEDLLDITDVLLVETHDRFSAGSSQAVGWAALRCGLVTDPSANSHTDTYHRL